MDRLESMHVLLVVVDAGSLSAAARRLRAPLATVSRNIAALERRLGTSLLVRRSRRVELTESGRAYVETIRPLLAQISDADRTAGGEYRAAQGELAVTAPVLFGRMYVVPLLVEFLAEHPAIRGRAMLVDRHVDLVEERMDVAIRIGRLRDPSLVAARVGALRRVVCASPAYLARLRDAGVGLPARRRAADGGGAVPARRQ